MYLNKRTERWYAQIVVDRKTFNLGTYADFSDAVAARKARLEEKYFGQYSYDNSIVAVPRIDAHVDQLVRVSRLNFPVHTAQISCPIIPQIIRSKRPAYFPLI